MAGKRRGPPPTPTKLKVLRGNPGKRKINTEEPQPALVDKAPPPAHLPALAQEKWREIVTELCRLELLTIVDMTGLEMACLAYQRWRDNEDWVTKHGGTLVFREEQTIAEKRENKPGKIRYVQTAPQVTAAKQACETYRAFMAEYGLSPAARTRLTGAKKEVDDADLDRFFG